MMFDLAAGLYKTAVMTWLPLHIVSHTVTAKSWAEIMLSAGLIAYIQNLYIKHWGRLWKNVKAEGLLVISGSLLE